MKNLRENGFKEIGDFFVSGVHGGGPQDLLHHDDAGKKQFTQFFSRQWTLPRRAKASFPEVNVATYDRTKLITGALGEF